MDSLCCIINNKHNKLQSCWNASDSFEEGCYPQEAIFSNNKIVKQAEGTTSACDGESNIPNHYCTFMLPRLSGKFPQLVNAL